MSGFYHEKRVNNLIKNLTCLSSKIKRPYPVKRWLKHWRKAKHFGLV